SGHGDCRCAEDPAPVDSFQPSEVPPMLVCPYPHEVTPLDRRLGTRGLRGTDTDADAWSAGLPPAGSKSGVSSLATRHGRTRKGHLWPRHSSHLEQRQPVGTTFSAASMSERSGPREPLPDGRGTESDRANGTHAQRRRTALPPS